MGWLRAYDRWIRRICTWMGIVGAVAVLFIQLMTTADVILRDVFTLPIRGTFELTEYSMAVVVFCAWGLAQVDNFHITVDVVARYLPGRVRAVIECLLLILVVALFLAGAWIGYDQTMVMVRRGAYSSVLAVPRWPFQAMVIVGFLSLSLALVKDILFAVVRALGKEVYPASAARREEINVV